MRDTIAAIASGMTASGIGIVRISGPEAFCVLEKVFAFKNPKKSVRTVPSGTVHYGHIYQDPSRNELLDEVLVLIMKGPHTYTAEDTVEIDCHGGILVMQKIFSAVLSAGARAADPGEFTKRAFLNGRIDLSEAEAVMDIIAASSDEALQSSLSQLGGSLRRQIESIRERILLKAAYLEAALDDPEHYDLDSFSGELLRDLVPVREELIRLRDSFSGGRLIRDGILTVILGAPNVGKSSLLNLLSGTDRAIVTDIAGTTRDTLEETVRVGGLALRLSDTAGIRDTENVVEKIGVERAMSLADSADLILLILDASRQMNPDEIRLLSYSRRKKSIILLNKTDLSTILTVENVENLLRSEDNSGKVPKIIQISALTGEGVQEFGKAVREMFLHGEIAVNPEKVLTNVRHHACVSEAFESLDLVLKGISQSVPEDFFTVDLMDAYASLGKILGEEIDDDLVDTIFSKFCMGK